MERKGTVFLGPLSLARVSQAFAGPGQFKGIIYLGIVLHQTPSSFPRSPPRPASLPLIGGAVNFRSHFCESLHSRAFLCLPNCILSPSLSPPGHPPPHHHHHFFSFHTPSSLCSSLISSRCGSRIPLVVGEKRRGPPERLHGFFRGEGT